MNRHSKTRQEAAWLVVAVLAVAAFGACDGGEGLASLPEARAAAASASKAARLEVETAVARAEAIARTVVATGATQPIRAANLGVSTMGTILSIEVAEGDHVAEGQLLVRLDAGMAKLQTDQARAAVAAVKAQADILETESTRMAKLVEAGAIALSKSQQLQAQRTAVLSQQEAAEAGARLAGRNASNSALRAPFAGQISKIFQEEGELATMMPPMPVMRLIDLSRVEVRVPVNERDLVRLRQGDRVVARISSLGVELEGQVASVGIELHPLTRSAEVVTVFDNADGRLRGGMFAEVEIFPESSRRAVVLPRSALGGSGDERFVYVVDQCRARRRPVTTIDLDDSRVEVREGVREGEVVVVRGVARIADGAAIEAGSGCTAAVAARAEAVR